MAEQRDVLPVLKLMGETCWHGGVLCIFLSLFLSCHQCNMMLYSVPSDRSLSKGAYSQKTDIIETAKVSWAEIPAELVLSVT